MTHRNAEAVRHFFFCTGLLIALAYAVASLHGCGILGSRVGAMADTVGYERALDDCLKEAHRLGRSRAVYDQCASEADIRYGMREGGAP